MPSGGTRPGRRYVNLQTLNNFSGIFMDSEGVLVSGSRQKAVGGGREGKAAKAGNGRNIAPARGDDGKIVDPDGGEKLPVLPTAVSNPIRIRYRDRSPSRQKTASLPRYRRGGAPQNGFQVPGNPQGSGAASGGTGRRSGHHFHRISAYFPDGVSDDVVRTVTENCRTLKFKISGFEEE